MPPDTVVDHQLLPRVRELRDTGLSVKRIARTLGEPPATVASLVRAVAEQDRVVHTDPGVVGCWVSPGWSHGLSVDGHEEWRDVENPGDGPGGMACVAVARRERTERVSVAGYLVDTHCLGVKNALGPRRVHDRDLPAFVQTFFRAFDPGGSPLPAPLELARHLVYGGVDAARSLGFEPHPDFAAAAGHLGAWTETSAITFGNYGVPFYVEGPYDDASSVLRTLSSTVGEGNFHFLASAPALL